MRARQPLPRLWLMTDERLGEKLFDAIARLPDGGGIVFRHYALDPAQRSALFARVRDVTRQRGQLLLLAGPAELARAWGADGSHGNEPGSGLRSAPVHDLAEIRTAQRTGADLLFLSPLHATRSHPGKVPLGPARFADLARQTRLPVIALGGMDSRRAQDLDQLGAYGWAAIDAWIRED